MKYDLFELVRSGFETDPDQPALVTPHGQLVSYSKLADAVGSFSSHLLHHGVKPGSQIALEINNPAVFIALALAISRVGAVYLGGVSTKQLKREGINIDAVVADSIRPRGPEKEILFTQAWVEKCGHPIPAAPGLADEQSLAAVLASSGTTGRPKYMAFSLSMIQKRLWDHDEVHGNGSARCLITFGLSSPFGFELALRTLRLGGMITWPAESAQRTLEQISRHKIDEVYAAPGTLAELVYQQRKSECDLSSLKRVVTAGSAVSRSHAELARRYLAPDILNEYGSSELGPVACTCSTAETMEPGVVGVPAPWIEVQIEDPGGEVRFRSKGQRLVDGYINTSAQDEVSAFRDEWFIPGDTGFIDNQRRLVITGRSADLINTGGNKVSCEIIRAAVEKLPHVKACVAIPVCNNEGYDDIGLVVVPVAEFDKDGLVTFMADTFENTASLRILTVPRFPLLRSGKTDLKKLSKALQAVRRSEFKQ
ncbi:MAG: class I adenylate-forming enzyme family protein [Pseudomonadota bacterium]